MRNLSSYIKDTKDFLKIIEKKNDEGMVSDKISIVTADMENMYGNMPLELSKQGISEYWDSLGENNDDISKEELLEALDICQENNIFEFKDKLFKQKIGHATGQKQAPPQWLAVGLE